MQTSERQRDNKLSILKHYLGGPAFASDEHHATVGEIENIDFESDAVCIKSGSESHWFESSIVDASLKQFKQLTADDVLTLVEAMIFDGERIHRSEVISINQERGTDIFVKVLDGSEIHINDMFWIHKDKTPVDNIGDIIFLLCDMGFDVRRKS